MRRLVLPQRNIGLIGATRRARAILALDRIGAVRNIYLGEFMRCAVLAAVRIGRVLGCLFGVGEGGLDRRGHRGRGRRAAG